MAPIMTCEEFIQRAKKLADGPSFYCNKYPFNLCMVCPPASTATFKDCKGKLQTNRNKLATIAVSADCWNLYKAILNGYDVNNKTVGYYQKDLSKTGDVDGANLMKQCTDVSADFTKLKNGEPRLLYMSGHAGAFIGLNVIGGHSYNVIESTGSWERKILYSWVDPDGTRRRYQGGAKNGKWAKHGLMTKWVNYSSAPINKPTEPVNKKTNQEIAKEVLDGKWGNGTDRKNRLTAAGYNYTEVQKIVNEMAKKPSKAPVYIVEYKVKAGDTLSAIAKRNATTVQALMALNPQIKDPNKIRTGQIIRVK